jgi:hypothetical protein
MKSPGPLFSTLAAGGLMLLATACSPADKAASTSASSASQPAHLAGLIHPSNFEHSHDTYNGMGSASDGRIYYVLCSELPDLAGRMYVYDPATNKSELLGDLTEVSGEKGMAAVAQGKSHVNFVEAGDRLFFATHIGYYSIIDDMEKPGVPPAGMKPYRGGHILAFNKSTRKFEDFGVAPRGEGIITMNMDIQRQRVYGITWPGGILFRYDIPKREWKDLGPFFEQGENGKGATYRTICRSLGIDPEDGSVYFTTGDGNIHRYGYDRETVETVQGDNLKKDYFGLYDVTSSGHMAYNWRQVFYHPGTRMFYGVHGNSGYLFRFDPRAERVAVLQRITSMPSQRAGMFDQFSYGYLGFALGPDNQTIYYLTGGPIYRDGKRVRGKDTTGKGEAKGEEDLHLVTYNIPTATYRDHGAVYYSDGGHPSYVNSIAVGKDNTVYTLARVPQPDNKVRTELISIRPQP